MYDLVIKGGLVIDPSQGIHDYEDVALSEGKIVAVEKGLNAAQAKRVVDASGKIVTPGLVDLHAHVYDAVMPLGVEADSSCLTKGVTTVLDAGSAGYINFPGFRKYVIEKCRTRVYALLNMGAVGLMFFGTDFTPLSEDPRLINSERTVETIKENRNRILGIKWHNTSGPKALVWARQSANLANCRLMCENSAYFWLPLWHILRYLKAGDVLTHIFHGGPGIGILDEDGKVLSEVHKAIKRGVVLDVGHGSASFCFDTAEKAMDQGVTPDVISTDLHSGNINGPVFDMPTTLSKFLMLGLSLDDVILRSTFTPAKVMGLTESSGSLKVGMLGDVSVLKLNEGKFVFKDAMGNERIGDKKLIPTTVILGGQVVHDEDSPLNR